MCFLHFFGYNSLCASTLQLVQELIRIYNLSLKICIKYILQYISKNLDLKHEL